MASSKGPILLAAAAAAVFMVVRKSDGYGSGGGKGDAPVTTTFDIDKEVDFTSLAGGEHLLEKPGDKLVISWKDAATAAYEVNQDDEVDGWLKVTATEGGKGLEIERVVPLAISTEETIKPGPLADAVAAHEEIGVKVAAVDLRLLPSETIYAVNVLIPRKG